MQRQADEAVQRQRREYELRKAVLFEHCRVQARTIVSDEGRAGQVGALASNLVTGEPHPPELLESICQDDRETAKHIADDMLTDAQMRDYAGDTMFWLAEALFAQAFDFKTNTQSPESIAKAKERIQLARERGGDKPLYFSLLSQVEMSAGEAKKAYHSAKRGLAKLPADLFSDDAHIRILRSELLRLQANAAVALGNLEEARLTYLAAKDFNPKIQGVDEALRALNRR
jgi:tetratricopeptide (TPR) repeat protein